jgi:DNA-binding PadR family transcriptional regulator
VTISKPELTELEGVILGIVASRQPCSPYVVRSRFERSPTWGWSSSKGAIYPAVRRLVSRGLISTTPLLTGRRKSELLALTDIGRQSLRAWVLDLEPGVGGAPIDPIRTRVNYLAALEPAERVRFLDCAVEEARRALKVALASEPDPEASDRWALEATWLGVRSQVKAKLNWLEELRDGAKDT